MAAGRANTTPSLSLTGRLAAASTHAPTLHEMCVRRAEVPASPTRSPQDHAHGHGQTMSMLDTMWALPHL